MSRMTPRPPKGTAAKAKRARKRAELKAELAAKAAAKFRDGFRCRHCHYPYSRVYIEAAHVDDKGMGGDHGLRSSSQADYVTLCRMCHQGPRSVHSGHLEMVVGPMRGDGEVRFRDKWSA
jgi:hypothetical protein